MNRQPPEPCDCHKPTAIFMPDKVVIDNGAEQVTYEKDAREAHLVTEVTKDGRTVRISELN